MRIPWRILVVDDEPAMRDSLTAWLREDGHEVAAAESGERAVAMVREEDYNLCFMDMKMPGRLDGIAALREIKRLRPEATVVIITAFGTVDTAIEAMKVGAYDYIVKPFNPEEISILTKRILEVEHLRQENLSLRRRLSRRIEFDDIVSKSARMQAVLETVRYVADLPAPILVAGERGTGKDLVARAVHQAGRRSSGPFAHVSCGTLTEAALAAELFGTEEEPGSGRIAGARGGTIFLERVETLPGAMLEHLFEEAGGEEGPRVVASTVAGPEAAKDLHERMFEPRGGVMILVPALRDRREDIPSLVRHLIGRLAVELRVPVRGIDAEAMKLLLERDWPGNVRELENSLERAMATCDEDQLSTERFDFLIPRPAASPGWQVPTNLSLAEIELQVIPAVLERARGDLTEAARILGIERAALVEKLERHGIDRPEGTSS